MAWLLESFTRRRWVARRAAGWVERQRRAHRPHASPLAGETRERLRPFFAPATLEPVRVRSVARVQPPTGLDWLSRRLPLPLDFERVYGIAFVDTILVAEGRIPEASRLPTLFHECVHVAQYRLLGVDEFMRRYLAGWVEGGYRYQAIPLEREAYDLQRRFMAEPEKSFSVEAQIDIG